MIFIEEILNFHLINKLTRARNITLDYFTLRDCGPQRDRNLVTYDKLIILLGKTQ